ncbi:MAG: YqgE/AlgH family protein [Alphaproteobacteria bacterium]|nr:MAG: YqgE/AlgH family protein [Alphaproteobacteria bacterium]
MRMVPPHEQEQESLFLEGQLLLAMPGIGDPRFERSVIFVCSHSAEGAMGLIVNRPFEGLTFRELLDQLEIEVSEPVVDIPIQVGGPVETGRGFVLHSTDFIQDTSLVVTERIALTATVDILKAIAEGGGPKHRLLLLGYAGWAPGQLEAEIQANGWLTAPADESLIFETPLPDIWPRAMRMLGVDVSMLSGSMGHA